MSYSNKLYIGCPVQYVRQFIAGKWQMGILWNLKGEPLSFGEIRSLLPEVSDKMLMEELNFFVEKQIVVKEVLPFPTPRTEYRLSHIGNSLIPIITAIVNWGYEHIQEERVNTAMSKTPFSIIVDIENSMPSEKE